MRQFLLAILTVIMLTISPKVASAEMVSVYSGRWYSETNPEYLELGFRDAGDYLRLSTTPRYCGSPGAPYSEVRKVLKKNGPNRDITWWVDQYCNDGYVRVCVENYRGRWACSTYQNLGWRREYY